MAEVIYDLLTNDFIPLINVISAREEHSATDHLAHDAAHRPDVHVLVVAHAQNDFRCTVIPRDHVRRHHEGGACSAGQSKVEDFQCAIRLDYDVGWLQILLCGGGRKKLRIELIIPSAELSYSPYVLFRPSGGA